MTPPQPALTTIALLVGDVAALAASATQLLIGLRYFSERDTANGPIIVVVDGPEWLTWLNTQGNLSATIMRATLLPLPATTHLPGVMVNQALNLAGTDLVGIVAIGCEVSTWYANQGGLVDAMRADGSLMAAGYRGPGETRSAANEPFLVHHDDPFSSAYPYAWLQMLDLVPMSNCVISTALIRTLGGFSEAPAMQRMWWWEFTLRAARHHNILSLPLQPVPATSWHHFDFANVLGETVDANLRTMMKLGGERGRCLPMRQDEQRQPPVAGDAENQTQGATWRSLPAGLGSELLALARQRPLKIVVLGGVNEPAHNQLCFFNYFALMRDWHVLTWRSILDERATIDDLAGCDLVIFSRVRSDNGVTLMEACAKQRIRTLYMLDDNWFWLGREWDDYTDIFAPGKPPYENFIRCVQLADTCLTYSAPLAGDLKPLAKRLVTLPINVDLAMFPPRDRQAGTGNTKTIIGYVGSLRKNMMAFDALVDLATRRRDVSIFVMSNVLPAEFTSLPADRVRFEPYQFNYEAYAATVTRARPDILVAPVGRTRFEASKCPNKFLEITACGAVGVYSRAEPYLSHVVDQHTGVFADDSVSAWTTAIEQLIDSPDSRQRIGDQARAHVAGHFATPAVLPQFVRMLLTALSADHSSD